MRDTAKAIFAWDTKIFSYSKNSKFCKQEIYKNDHNIDIHVYTEVLTTGLVIPSWTKRLKLPHCITNSFRKFQLKNYEVPQHSHMFHSRLGKIRGHNVVVH